MDDMYFDSLIDTSGLNGWSDTATDHVSHNRGAVILVDPVIYDPKHESAVKSASTEIEAQLAASGTAEMVATWRALLQEPPLPASVSGEYLFTTRDDLFNTEPIRQLNLSAVSWKPKSAEFLRNLQSVGLVRLILDSAGPKPALWHLPWPFNFQSELGQGGSQNPSASALQLNLVEEEGGPTQLWDTMYQVMSHVLPMESLGEDGEPLKLFKVQFLVYDNKLKQSLPVSFSTTIPSDVDGSVMTVGDRGVLAVIDMMCLNRIQVEVDRQRVPRNEFTLDIRNLARAIGFNRLRLQQLVEVTAVVKRILFTETHSSTELDVELADDVSEITSAAFNNIMRAFESPQWGTRVREGMEAYEFVQFSLHQKKFDAMVQRAENGTPMMSDIPRLVTRLGETGRGKRGLLSDAGMIVLVDLAYTFVVKRKPKTWHYDELHHVFRLTQDSDKQRFEKVNRVLRRLIQIASLDPERDLEKFDGTAQCKIVMAFDQIELILEFKSRAPRTRRVGTLTLKGRTAAISSDQKTPEQPLAIN